MSDLPEPISREDYLLHNIAVGTPNIDDMIPMSREEEYLKYIATHGSGGGGISGTVEINQGGTGATTAEGARENLEVYKPYILYDNPTGTSGTINLSDDSNNYEYLEIFYGGDVHILTSTRVPISSYTEGIALVTSNYYEPTVTTHLKCVYLNLANDIITFDTNTAGFMYFLNEQLPTVLNTNVMLVYRVVGYKY